MTEKHFAVRPLTGSGELQSAFRLRYRVFVEEQNVPVERERDEDDGAVDTVHIGCFDGEQLIGTARITGCNTRIVHIGRVAVDKAYRGCGVGRQLIDGCEGIAASIAVKPFSIVLGAQLHAEPFYLKIGYVRVNNHVYQDAGIDHVDMKKDMV